jgi:ribonuclease HI
MAEAGSLFRPKEWHPKVPLQIATGNNFNETARKLEYMMTKEDGGLKWSQDHNSPFEISKSVIMHASRRTQASQEDERKRVPLDRPPLTINGTQIKEVENFKYLGVLIDAQLRWNAQSQKAISSATNWLLQFCRLTTPATGVKAKLMRQLYMSVAVPKMTYGMDIWHTPPTKPVGAARNQGSVAALRGLQKAQRIATLAITGALRTTPTDLLDAHAGLLPTDLLLLKVAHRAAVRLCTLPNSHPLHEAVLQASTSRPDKLLSPLDNLSNIFQLDPTSMEKILPTTRRSHHAPRFQIAMEDTREESIEMEKQDDADYRIYTNGSGNDENTGAAAVIYKKGHATPLKILQYHLGPKDEHNSYKAELVGGILGAWMAASYPETRGKTVLLYTDNQSLLKAIIKIGSKSGQHLVKALEEMASAVHCKLTLRWISGHSKVDGNEKADELAKQAAEGKSSTTRYLPLKLRRPTPVSASATKENHHKTLLSKWNE